ncbi:MAG: hypothetical protein IT234_08080 [Bacteroidia bacterium]|nr:hypothetical protein [Bacteroidia bacterium]
MKKLIQVFICLMVTYGANAQETFPNNGTSNPNHSIYAFVNAKIIVDPEQTYDNGTLVIKDGLIAAVGTKINIPKGAIIVDLKGKSIYPSLIDAYTTYGMPEVKKSNAWGVQMNSNTKGAYGWNQAVKADIEAYKLFVADSKAA